MMTNDSNRVIYTGVTSDIVKRVWQHKEGMIAGFTKRYRCKKLVFYELHHSMEIAISREKQIKGWLRSKKNQLVETINPQWKDLYDDVV